MARRAVVPTTTRRAFRRRVTLAAISLGLSVAVAACTDPVSTAPPRTAPKERLDLAAAPTSASFYTDRNAFEQAVGSGLTRIDFSTRDDGSSITTPSADQYFAALTLRGATIRDARSYYNLFVYNFPKATIHVDLPTGTIAVGTLLDAFYGETAQFTVRLSTGEVAHPDVGPGWSFFGVRSSQPIAWIEVVYDGDYFNIDDLEFAVDPAPVLTATATVGGAPYAAGTWTKDPVTVTFACQASAGVASVTAPQTVSTDGADQSVTGTCTDLAGRTATATFDHIDVDATAPVVTPTVAGTAGTNGWFVSDVAVSWSTTDAASGIASTNGCAASSVTTDVASTSFACSATDKVGLSTSRTVTVKRDATPPTVAYTGNAGTYTLDQSVVIACTAADATSGLATSTCANVVGPAYGFGLGVHSYSAGATDNAGNTATTSTTFRVIVTAGSLCQLTKTLASDAGVATALCAKLAAADESAQRGDLDAKSGQIGAYINQVAAQTGKAFSRGDAALLIGFARAL